MKRTAGLFFLLFIINEVTAQTGSLLQAKPIKDRPHRITAINPILPLDFSDPDVIRVKNKYYLVASSFHATPGLPILESSDLVHWQPLTYALPKLLPDSVFDKPQHGKGVWAPAIRFHQGQFYIFYADPDQGIFVTRSTKIEGPWTVPELVEGGKGLIDPCPLWDEDGKVYLVHAYAGSRSGIKSVLVVKPMNLTATKVVGAPVLIYDGHGIDATVEGPKFYKRNGFYYVFAPAGGVEKVWQIVLRSKSVYGPYERKKVLAQGNTLVNGPHQGGWVEAIDGTNWFVHFQDREAYGRIVHLQPLKWVNDWPMMGKWNASLGVGEPVDSCSLSVSHTRSNSKPFSDYLQEEATGLAPGWIWQWNANQGANWVMANPAAGVLRFNAMQATGNNLLNQPNLLLQKFPATSFVATMKFLFHPGNGKEKFGMIVYGKSYAGIVVQQQDDKWQIGYQHCADQFSNQAETIQVVNKEIPAGDLYFRIEVKEGGRCTFLFSIDGSHFTTVADDFVATAGRWVGAKIGFYCIADQSGNDRGFADVDWFRIKILPESGH